MSWKAYFDIPNDHGSHKGRYNQHFGGFIDESVVFEGTAIIGVGAIIEENVTIGDGCFIGHHAIIRPRSVLKKNSELRAYGWIANDVIVGHDSVIYQYANLSMGTVVGNYVYFGVGSITTNADDIVLHRGRPFVPNPCVIEDGVRVATRVTILPGVTIGHNALIGAGSLLTKAVGPYEQWFGHPAKMTGKVSKDDVPKAWIDPHLTAGDPRRR